MERRCPDYLKAALLMLEHCFEAGLQDEVEDTNRRGLNDTANALLEDWGSDLIQKSKTWKMLSSRFDRAHQMENFNNSGPAQVAIFESDLLVRQMLFAVSTQFNFSSFCCATPDAAPEIIMTLKPNVVVIPWPGDGAAAHRVKELLTSLSDEQNIALLTEASISPESNKELEPYATFSKPLQVSQIYSYFHERHANLWHSI